MKKKIFLLFGIVFIINLGLGLIQFFLLVPVPYIMEFEIMSGVAYIWLNLYFYSCKENGLNSNIGTWIWLGVPLFFILLTISLMDKTVKSLSWAMLFVAIASTLLNWYFSYYKNLEKNKDDY